MTASFEPVFLRGRDRPVHSQGPALKEKALTAKCFALSLVNTGEARAGLGYGPETAIRKGSRWL